MLKRQNFLLIGNVFTCVSCRRFLRNQPRIGFYRIQETKENEHSSFPPLLLNTKLDHPAQQKEKPQFSKADRPAKVKKLRKNKMSAADVTEDNMYDMVSKVVVPLARVPYYKQLKIKHTTCLQVLQQLARELKTESKIILPRDTKGLPCPLENVRPSPETTAYRNKNEFGIRPGVDGNPKTVGFFIGSPVDNSTIVCVQPNDIISTKPIHLHVAKHFQNYIRQSSLPVCIDFKDGGNWRYLFVRSNIHGDLMVVVVMHPQDLSEEEITSEKEKIKTYFTEGPGKELNVKSFFFQTCQHSRCYNEQVPFQLLFGEPYIFEEVGNFSIRVSPETFLPVNASAAPILYETIRDLSGVTNSTTVLDISCGAGSLGMHLAEKAGHVIGIDISSQAVDDAKHNIKLNGIKNMAVIHGSPDVVIPRVMDDFYSDDLVAVIHGRFKNAVFRALRECKHLRRIIYVSSKPDGETMKNYVKLCKKSKMNLGPPFIPLYAVPVDLYPHTERCELVVMFERTD